MLDETTLKAMSADFKSIKPLNDDQKKPKIDFEGEAAESRVSVKKESIKQDGRPRDMSG
jgi:hypothetical protein